MSTVSFSPSDQGSTSNRDAFSVFQKKAAKTNSIREGMSPKEIADIVSDKVIKEVQKQFEATKAAYLSKRNK